MYECPGGALLSAAAPGSAASAGFPDSVPAEHGDRFRPDLPVRRGLQGGLCLPFRDYIDKIHKKFPVKFT